VRKDQQALLDLRAQLVLLAQQGLLAPQVRHQQSLDLLAQLALRVTKATKAFKVRLAHKGYKAYKVSKA
jgi:hypothetical protein